MKKFLVLLLVLGIAGSASAALQLSVDGVRDPVESQIWIEDVGGTATIEIWTDATISAGVGEGYWALGVNSDAGTLSGGQGLYGGDTSIYLDSTYLPTGENGYWLGIGMATNPSIAAGENAFDSILLTCEGEGDSVVTLYSIDFMSDPVPLTSVVIHQIPEPATICLLGLGGLALLRRRK